jgi:hypothetical protein
MAQANATRLKDGSVFVRESASNFAQNIAASRHHCSTSPFCLASASYGTSVRLTEKEPDALDIESPAQANCPHQGVYNRRTIP